MKSCWILEFCLSCRLFSHKKIFITIIGLFDEKVVVILLAIDCEEIKIISSVDF